MKNLLNGIYDLHIHTAPDVTARKCTDLEAAQRMTAAGMAGGAIKCHYLDTAARAALLREQFPRLNIAGGIVLNRSVGGLNPHAVERTAQAGGQMLWFPTLESMDYQRYHKHENYQQFVSVCSEDGKLLPAALDVLDVAAAHKMVVGTGHISALHGLEVVREGCRRGCVVVLTHADNPADQYTVEQQVEAVKMGAVIEHSFFTTYYDRTPAKEIARQIRAVGAENVILTTDFGQTKSPYFDEGMAQYITVLREQGLTDDELWQMTHTTPERLISRG